MSRESNREGPFFHVGFIVSDLEAAMAELTDVLGIEWRPVLAGPLPLAEAGAAKEIVVRAVYSVGGPPAIELVEAVPGTVLDGKGDMSFHHLGVWTDDLAQASAEMNAHGWPCAATVAGDGGGPNRFALQRSPHGFNVELFDVTAARYPDLLPRASSGGDNAPA